VPAGSVISSLMQLPIAVRRCHFPVVIKPADGTQGTAATTWLGAVRAFVVARRRSRRVAVERCYPGHDYCLLVVGGRLVTATLRSPDGTARDVTATVHPENVHAAECIARVMGLDSVSIDVASPDIARPLWENHGVVLALNAGPGLQMRLASSDGTTRGVAAAILDSLFPAGGSARIPIVAVTGTNGKTTTTRLVAHLLSARGLRVGWCSSDGVYIEGRRVVRRDATGSDGARAVLRDPVVEAAVLEVARGGLLQAGLGFDGCDVGILLNVDADHLGLGGVETVEELARVKGAVIEAVRPGGLAILNADDPLACAQASRTRGRVGYFTFAPDAPLVRAHVGQGGLAAMCDGDDLLLLDGTARHLLGHVADVPMTLAGRAPFMAANALAASLAAFALGMSSEDIRAGLATFTLSPAQNAARMNLFDCGRVQVLVDYAHNPHGLRALAGFLRSWEGPRVAMVGMYGDRRDQDYLEFGDLCAHTFDLVIVREARKQRRRALGEAAAMIARGIAQADTGCRYEIVHHEDDAVRRALESAPDGALVTLLADDKDAVLALVQARR
jgi:cyanophycin synthetase